MKLTRKRIHAITVGAREQIRQGVLGYDEILRRVLRALDHEANQPSKLLGALAPVIRECAFQFGIDEDTLLSRQKWPQAADARHCTFLIARDLGMSAGEVSRAFCRDESTIRHAFRVTAEAKMAREDFAQKYAAAKRTLRMQEAA